MTFMIMITHVADGDGADTGHVSPLKPKYVSMFRDPWGLPNVRSKL